MTERYDAWMAVGSQEYTAQRNLKAPPRRKIVNWILEAWKNVRKMSSSHGSEDQLIHCFKEDQPCCAGLHRLVMANIIEDEREDPLISINDSEADMKAINELDSDNETDEVIDI